MSIRRLSLVFILFLVAGSVFGQNYRPGFVIFQSGDTIRGEVSYFQANQFDPRCYFIQEGHHRGHIIEYRPSEVFQFGFDEGGLFQSHDREDGMHFLEVLVQGPLMVLNTFGYYLIEQRGTNGDVLFFQKKLVSTEGEDYFLNPIWNNRALLDRWTSECGDVLDGRYQVVSREALLDWAAKYNACLGEEYSTHQTERSGYKVDVGGIYGGYAGHFDAAFLGDVALGNQRHDVMGSLRALTLEVRYGWISYGMYYRFSMERFGYTLSGSGYSNLPSEGERLHEAMIDIDMLTNRHSIGYDFPLGKRTSLYLAPEVGLSLNVPVDDVTYDVSEVDAVGDITLTRERNGDYRAANLFIGYSAGLRLKKELYNRVNLFVIGQYRSGDGILERYRTQYLAPERTKLSYWFIGSGATLRVIR